MTQKPLGDACETIDDMAELQQRYRRLAGRELVMSALVGDYEAIYCCDLETDTIWPIKESDSQALVRCDGDGYSSIGRRFYEKLVVEDSAPDMLELLNRENLMSRLEHSQSLSIRYRVEPDADGRTHMETRVVRMQDADGFKVVLGTRFIDETIKEQQEQKRRLKEALQAEEAARAEADAARDVAEAALVEASRANEAKTNFLRRISHDIRTPINGIRGMIAIAECYPDDKAKQKECRKKTLMATDHLLSLVNDVLDMSKLESGNFVLKRDPFSLKQVLGEVNSITESQAREFNVRFVCKDVGQVEHDRLIGSSVYLKRVFLNFMSNAIKYNRDGGLVSVYGRELSFDGRVAEYEFVCEDTGIGMSEEFQKRAFEPFAQEESSQGRKTYAGTGLGLAIAKDLVDLMGGSVDLHSEEGVGTKVIFRIPFEVDMAKHAEKEEIDYEGMRFDGVCALLAEDNELNAEIAAFVLRKHGIETFWAQNGKVAVKAISERPDDFDVVFLDVMMPVMDGLEAARAIRRLGCDVPIFAMTANAFTDDVQKSLDAGMNAHLTKPLREKDIVKALLENLPR